jgi:membrane-associated phospholipid phosphatase
VSGHTWAAVDAFLLAVSAAILAGAWVVGSMPAAAGSVATACAIALAVTWRSQSDQPAARLAHDWCPAPAFYVLYLSVGALNAAVNGSNLADGALIAIDRWLLRLDPTVWLSGVAHPALTEVLQAAYTGFYPLLLLVGAQLYARADHRAFRAYVFTLALGFSISFAGYLLVPAVGPRFTLHDARALPDELPGLLLTPWLRAFVDAGGLSAGPADPAAAFVPNPDAFPSGHTMMTLIAVWFAWRRRTPARRAVALWGGMIVAATVYLRYHYVVDVVAGVVLAAACIGATPPLHRLVARRVHAPDAADA